MQISSLTFMQKKGVREKEKDCR